MRSYATYTHIVLFDLYDLLSAFKDADKEMDAKEGYMRNPASHTQFTGGESGSGLESSTGRTPPGVHVLVC